MGRGLFEVCHTSETREKQMKQSKNKLLKSHNMQVTHSVCTCLQLGHIYVLNYDKITIFTDESFPLHLQVQVFNLKSQHAQYCFQVYNVDHILKE